MSATRPRRYGSIVNIAERCAASLASNSLRRAKRMRDFIPKPSGPISGMLWEWNRQVERVAILPVHRAVGRLGNPGRVPMLVTLPPQNELPGAVIIERPSPPTLPIGCGLLTSRIPRPWRAFSFSPSFSSRATTTRVAGTRRSDISHPPNLIGAWLRPRVPPLEVKSKTLHQTEPASGSIPAQLRPKLRKRRDRIGAIVHRIRALQHPLVRI